MILHDDVKNSVTELAMNTSQDGGPDVVSVIESIQQIVSVHHGDNMEVATQEAINLFFAVLLTQMLNKLKRF